MDFQLSEEQQLLKDSARRLLEAECGFARRGDVIREGSFDSAHWTKFAEMGWLALTVPEPHGGLGCGSVETGLLMEEIGRSLCVEPYWAVCCLTVPVLAGCEDDTAGAMLAAVAEGRLRPVLAHGEEQSGGKAEWVATTATASGDGAWKISGGKSLVVGGNVADLFIVSARTSGAVDDADGITLFVLDKNTPGLRCHPVRLLDNRWAMHLDLNDVVVDAGQVLGPVGGAFSPLRRGLDLALLALGCEAIGVMEAALWITRDYITTRKQFGTTLSTFQSLQHRMSDMLIELELARCMVYRAHAYLGAEEAVRRQALSAMKCQVGNSGKFVCGQAIQLHGGIGVTEEYVIGHYFKRMTLIESALGNSHQHLEFLADGERGGSRNPLGAA